MADDDVLTIVPGTSWPVSLVLVLAAWLPFVDGEILVAPEDRALLVDAAPDQRVTVQSVRVPRRALAAAMLLIQAAWTPRPPARPERV
jgi:hypothetical protein